MFSVLQGIIGASYEGVGVSLGSFLGGYFYSKYGGALTFRIFGVAAFVACCLHVLASLLVLYRTKRMESIKK